ncbi:MAG: Fic family protein, partial [candidate division WOR-3 bacterium]|nr:Fic family protein [candidate division WOR-3 bacterium]
RKISGKAIPKDIESIIHKFRSEIQKNQYIKLEKIKKDFQKEWRKYPATIKDKEREEIAIAFTYNTNAIEGSTITLEETRGIIQDKISPNKPLKDIKETEAHYRVFLAMLDNKERISHKHLLSWHKEIFGETKPDIAGKFRNYFVRVGNYLAPDWRDVKKLLTRLIKFINGTKINSVELAARAHYKFEKIHPFGDGNGRIGRLIMNHLLWHRGYPMLIVEFKTRSSYYKTLQRDEERFVDYFLRKYLSVHKKRT